MKEVACEICDKLTLRLNHKICSWNGGRDLVRGENQTSRRRTNNTGREQKNAPNEIWRRASTGRDRTKETEPGRETEEDDGAGSGR